MESIGDIEPLRFLRTLFTRSCTSGGKYFGFVHGSTLSKFGLHQTRGDSVCTSSPCRNAFHRDNPNAFRDPTYCKVGTGREFGQASLSSSRQPIIQPENQTIKSGDHTQPAPKKMERTTSGWSKCTIWAASGISITVFSGEVMASGNCLTISAGIRGSWSPNI